MILEMYLGGQQIDAIKIIRFLDKHRFTLYLGQLKKELIRKHRSVLVTSGADPVFVLAGVPSRINSFAPIKNTGALN
jgi:hypothetical protein